MEEVGEEGVAMIAVTVTTRPEEPKWLVDGCVAAEVRRAILYNLAPSTPCNRVSSSDQEHILYVTRGPIPVTYAFEYLYGDLCQDEDIIIYVHDDVEFIDSNWAERIGMEFLDPKVAIVGLGGATSIGVDDIYKVPYRIEQLIRGNYYSNQIGWKIHGERETGSRDVAVVDGFVMAIRTSFLKQIGGWGWVKSNFHCYDTAMCLMAARHGWKVRMVGAEVDHHGGGTSTKAEYINWCREHGTTVEREHQEPHVWLYNEFRDLLPLQIGGGK